MPDKPARRRRLTNWPALLWLPLLVLAGYGITQLLARPAARAGRPTPAAAATPPPAVAAAPGDPPPPAAVGLSRARPYPPGATVSLPAWDVRVVDEVIRGEAAWRRLAAANSFNEPPGPEAEYLLLRLQLDHRGDAAAPYGLALHVTGSQNRVHFSFDAGVVPPEPGLETELAGDSRSQGWKAYRIGRDETGLLLMVEDYAGEAGVRYLALTADPPPGAPLPATISPTDVGATLAEPAAVGQIATSAAWQITVQTVLRGEAAWSRILAANQFNDPPPDGMTYLLVQVQVRYIGQEEGPHHVSRYGHFQAVAADGAVYEDPVVVPPDPDLYADLFPQGAVTGWLVVQAAAGDDAPRLRFAPRLFALEPDAETRYFLLVGTGR